MVEGHTDGPASSCFTAGMISRAMTTKRVFSFLAILVFLVAIWEGYKQVGAVFDGVWPLSGIEMRPRPDNRNMPHVWDVVVAIFEPARRGGEPLYSALAVAAVYTLRSAVAGFAIGATLGFGLGVAFVRSTLAERAFLPYVVASQTIPIIALAPIVVIWGGRLGLPNWVGVALISTYLTFFPVAVNTLRGLRSPDVTATEMFRAYAAKPSETLWKLQVPAALPYIFTALKVSATASIVGAIVGELPAGFGEGLGRVLLQFNQTFASNPSRLYAAVLAASLVGILFVAVVTLAERLTLSSNRVQT